MPAFRMPRVADDAASRRSWHVACCLLPQLVLVSFGVGLVRGQLWYGLPVLLLMLLVPALDLLTGRQDARRFEASEFSRWQRALLRWNPRLYAVLNVLVVLCATFSASKLAPLELGLLLAASSLTSAVGFAAAHELLHAPFAADRWLQRALTTFLFYPHYELIHVYSHHVHVGTPADENTAWRGESIYAYLWRTVPGSARRCWQLDRERRSRAGRAGGRRWLGNRMWLHAAVQVAWLAGLARLSGSTGLLFYAGHVLGAHVVLESVNYLQHYGLLRSELAQPARYERTAARHSWDTYHFFSSYITFRVGHHANHHVSAGPYYALAPEAAAPQLPVGYFWAIPLVLLPPVWRWVIERKLPYEPSAAELLDTDDDDDEQTVATAKPLAGAS